MRVLITGGFGFIGGRIAAHLAGAGYKVILGSRKANIAPPWLPYAEVAQIDWNSKYSLEQSCTGVDVVIQAAGMNAKDCASDPVAALAFNGVANARLVEAASRVGVQQFLLISTVHVYADPLAGIPSEKACPRNLHPYATSHLAGEHAVLRANQIECIQGRVLRLSNTFGAPLHPEVNCWMLLVNDLCRQAVQTGNLVLQSSGLQQRDFIGLSKVCHIVEHAIANEKEFLKTGIFNVCSGRSRSVLEMAEFIQKRCKQVLGFEPILQRLEPSLDFSRITLKQQAYHLAATSPKLDEQTESREIDELLRFCQRNF